MDEKYLKISRHKMYMGGHPLGVQEFKGLPCRRFMNKARFFWHNHFFRNQPQFSAN